MITLPKSSLTYLGIQYLPLNSKFTKDPKNDVPQIMILIVFLIFALTISVITVAYSQDPGYDELSEEEHPLTFGFSNILGITTENAHFLDIPGMFANCFTFMYCFGKQASSMADSGLIPEAMKQELPILKTPYVALIIVTIICFVLNIFLFYYEEELLLRYSLVLALSTYIVFICF
eukprot:CAMPEP_0173155142 /NCGR_PEP_ID=MMETSP1105-20130129/13924_1 /TAXON_ID=2985 /ORGANISM="Ochromonas sp., Strain BG-1" /LENGTH=175 /DNA_ID=CAMNT_0014071501 /DNA_START=194 /DNA_END=718 /DNA_ORIENTATION=-